MSQAYMLLEDMVSAVGVIQPDSIISRTFYKDERFKAVLFGFDAGQELSPHTSTHAAIIQIVQGEAVVGLGDDQHEVKAGSWIHMPPGLKHSVRATSPLIMLLLMFGTD